MLWTSCRPSLPSRGRWVESHSYADVVLRIAMICTVFPRARVMILLNANRRTLLKLRRDLQFAAGMPFHLVANYPWPFEAGRLVCSLGCFNWHNSDFDLVLFPD